MLISASETGRARRFVRQGRFGAMGTDFPRRFRAAIGILCGHCVAVCPNAALAHAGLPDEAILPVPEELPAYQAS